MIFNPITFVSDNLAIWDETVAILEFLASELNTAQSMQLAKWRVLFIKYIDRELTDDEVYFSDFDDFQDKFIDKVTEEFGIQYSSCLACQSYYRIEKREYKHAGTLDDFYGDDWILLQVDTDKYHLRHSLGLDDEFDHYLVQLDGDGYSRVLGMSDIYLATDVYEYELTPGEKNNE